MLLKSRITALLLFSIGVTSMVGQTDLEKYKQEYPSREYIYLDIEIHLDIRVEDDQLIIDQTKTEKKLLLSNQAKLHQKETLHHSEEDRIKNLVAKSHVPRGKKYKTHEVKIFNKKEAISDRYFYDASYVTTFDYPEVQEGTICELSYTRSTDKAMFVPRIFLSHYAPIINYTLSVDVQDGIDLDIQGNLTSDEHTLHTTKKKKKTRHVLTMHNVRPYSFEPNGPSIASVAPHYIFKVNHYTNSKGEKISVMRDLEDLYREYVGLLEAIDTASTSILRSLVDSLIIDDAQEIEKVETLYDWVRSNIKYIAFEDDMGGFIPRDPQLVFDRRFGDCKDMSSLTVKMMDIANIRGHLTWVGTRDIPYDYTEMQGAFLDNHMIAMYQGSDGEFVYLDATFEHLPFGYPPPHIQEKQTLLHDDKNKYILVRTPKVDALRNRNYEKGTFEILDNDLVGTITATMNGYEYLKYKNIFGNYSKEQLEKRYQTYFSRGTNKSELTDITTSSDGHKIETSFDITIHDYISSMDNDMIINLNLEKVLADQRIPNNRKQPLDMEETYHYVREYELIIPQGFAISHIPEDFTYGSNENFFIAFSYKQEEDRIIYLMDLRMNLLWLQPEQVSDWNKFIKRLSNNYKENIILTKI